MNIASLKLSKIINTDYGLRDKVHELNREMPIKHRADGWCVEYCNIPETYQALVFNKKTKELLGRYVPFGNRRHKFVKGDSK